MDDDVLGNTAGCLLNGEPIPFFFGPDEGLVPLNPGPAQFNRATLVLDGVSASAKAITCLKNNCVEASLFEVACSSNACQSTANNNDIPLR